MTLLQCFILLVAAVFAVIGAATFEIVGEEIGRQHPAPMVARIVGGACLIISGGACFIGGSL